MSIEIPIIDSRSYDELIEEARKRIPQYSPEWTGFNVSDSSISLIIVFSLLSLLFILSAFIIVDFEEVSLSSIFIMLAAGMIWTIIILFIVRVMIGNVIKQLLFKTKNNND
jgi:hypothetical protein